MTRRRLLTGAAILVMVLAIVYVVRPVGHIPPFDANLVRLAETEIEGYCAGETLWASGDASGDAELAKECRARLRAEGVMSDEINMRAVQPAFCRGILEAGWAGDQNTCLTILEASRYWPTYDGGISQDWNRARPYPQTGLGSAGVNEDSDSRTGNRNNAPGRPDSIPHGDIVEQPVSTEETDTTTEEETTTETTDSE